MEAGQERKEMAVERNQRVIVVASFGTSDRKGLDLALGAIENAIAEAFPDYGIYRAFTSQAVVRRLKERGGPDVDDVKKALDRAAAGRVKELVVQPTHLLESRDYRELEKILKKHQGNFIRAAVGKPLLSSDTDLDAVTRVMAERTEGFAGSATAFCWMAHGTETEGNNVYARIQDKLEKAGYGNCYIGAMESRPSLEDVLQMLGGRDYEKIVLMPLMATAGHHAGKEMAGSGRNSWKSILENRGYEVRCVMEGLGQIPEIRNIYADHVRAALQKLWKEDENDV